MKNNQNKPLLIKEERNIPFFCGSSFLYPHAHPSLIFQLVTIKYSFLQIFNSPVLYPLKSYKQ